MKNDLDQLISKLRAFAITAKVPIFIIVSAVLLAYIVWQQQQIFNPPVDENRLEERRVELEAGKIKFDEKTLTEVLQRSTTGPSTKPDSAGDDNPFN